MKKCPYCFEDALPNALKCPHCQQFFLDLLIEVDYNSVEKRGCLFCGKKIFAEAKICKYCHKWIDAARRAADDLI